MAPAALARAPSTPSSLRQRLFSPNPLDHLTRRLSLSPLSARNRRAGLRASNSTSKLGDFSQKMSSPTTPETVRKRRGFRPLSIVTSALFPFDFDPVQTMEKAQSSQLDPPTSMKTPPMTDTNPELSEPQVLPSATPATKSDSTPSPSKAASIGSGTVLDDSDEAQRDDKSITSTIAIKKTPAPSIKAQIEKINVAEYLRRQEAATVQNPENHNPTVEADTKDVEILDEYPQFYNLPPPDPNSHPAFRLDPFNCTDDARPLTTNWTKYQIKQWTADKYLRDRHMLPEQNLESKSPLKKIVPFDRKSPEKEETSIFEALAEGSPVAASAPRKTPRTPRGDTFGLITPSELRIGNSASTPITDEFDKKSGGLRSLSNLFKPRSSTGTDNSKSSNASTLTISSPIDQSIIHPTATSELKRHDLVRPIPTWSFSALLTIVRNATFESSATALTSNSTGQACTLATRTQAMNGSPAISNAPIASPAAAPSAAALAVPTKLPRLELRTIKITHMEEKKRTSESWTSRVCSRTAKRHLHFWSVRPAKR